jgi:hypothetical protein
MNIGLEKSLMDRKLTEEDMNVTTLWGFGIEVRREMEDRGKRNCQKVEENRKKRKGERRQKQRHKQ